MKSAFFDLLLCGLICRGYNKDQGFSRRFYRIHVYGEPMTFHTMSRVCKACLFLFPPFADTTYLYLANMYTRDYVICEGRQFSVICHVDAVLEGFPN